MGPYLATGPPASCPSRRAWRTCGEHGGILRTPQHWLFDLDDTLYPASCGLFRLVSVRITQTIARLLGLAPDAARTLQRQYWLRYGTSLRGLILEHGVDPEPFLAFVHDVPVEEHLRVDPALRTMLQGLPGHRHIFTNGPREHAGRVLRALGIDDLFENVFDIRHSEFVPKPDAEAFQRVLDALGARGPDCILVDDAPPNLETARALGMQTVWVRAPLSVAGGMPGGSVELASSRGVDVVIDDVSALAALF